MLNGESNPHRIFSHLTRRSSVDIEHHTTSIEVCWLLRNTWRQTMDTEPKDMIPLSFKFGTDHILRKFEFPEKVAQDHECSCVFIMQPTGRFSEPFKKGFIDWPKQSSSTMIWQLDDRGSLVRFPALAAIYFFSKVLRSALGSTQPSLLLVTVNFRS